MINGQISITAHTCTFGMHEQSIDTSNVATKRTENISNVYTCHNINRMCQTRKIHQSATHLYSHRSISRHQFIAFAFIVDQTAAQLETGEKVHVCVCCVSHTGNIVAACFYDVHAYLCCVCECCLIPLFYSNTATATTTIVTVIFQCSLYDDNTSSSINVNNKSLCEMDVHEMRIKSTIERTRNVNGWSTQFARIRVDVPTHIHNHLTYEIKMIQRNNIWKTTCGNKCVCWFFFLLLLLRWFIQRIVLAKFRMTHTHTHTAPSLNSLDEVDEFLSMTTLHSRNTHPVHRLARACMCVCWALCVSLVVC